MILWGKEVICILKKAKTWRVAKTSFIQYAVYCMYIEHVAVNQVCFPAPILISHFLHRAKGKRGKSGRKPAVSVWISCREQLSSRMPSNKPFEVEELPKVRRLSRQSLDWTELAAFGLHAKLKSEFEKVTIFHFANVANR